ncbi:MAG: capsule assembly Wzi family protein [Prolixibacteraceae bacterium]|nr:capsule assembly Wzi family protein [Prolixibacteraceae bacterium]
MRVILFLLLFQVSVSGLKAQEGSSSPTFYASFRSYASTGKDLPFWFKANQNGTPPLDDNATQLLRTGFFRNMDIDTSYPWDYCYGTELVGGYTGKSYFQPNQYWAGIRYQWLVVKAGAEADPVRFGGLSSTNGRMDASNNARPLPQVSLGTNGYTSFPFKSGPLTWKALYAEGILLDNSWVQNAHLHHKNFYVKMDLSGEWNISAGVEHYVFWGGTSPTLGRLPGKEAYFNYLLSRQVSKELSNGDQVNIVGNQLGLYNLEVNKQWEYDQLTFYWNHPFQDRQEMKLANISDGLWGIHWEKQKPQILNEIVYEWMHTLNQSGNPLTSPGNGGDNYFYQGDYQSGFTHYSRMMGTPLFIPVVDANGVSNGFESTRMWMHHVGMKGFLGKNLSWKMLMTFSRNFGTNGNYFTKPLDELSILDELVYRIPRKSLQLLCGIASDSGNHFENRLGIYIGVKWMPVEEKRKRGSQWVNRRNRH